MGVVVRFTDKRQRETDARQHRRSLTTAARNTEATFDYVKSLIDDMKADGGYEDALPAVKLALWRLKQAEADLERAKARVKA